MQWGTRWAACCKVGVTKARVALQSQLSSQQSSAWLASACVVLRVFLEGLVLVAVRVDTSSTNHALAFTSKYVCSFPSAVLYDDSRAVLLGRVFDDALLQCVKFV